MTNVFGKDNFEKEVQYLCARRSTLELELLLHTFFQDRWSFLDEREKKNFLAILKMEDRTLEKILFKNEEIPPSIDEGIVIDLRNHRIK